MIYYISQSSDKFWPGLGSTESMYAWAIMVYFILQIASSPIAGILTQQLPYTITILLSSAIYAVSGVVYGMANTIWMVIISRALMGCAAAFSDVVTCSYIGEMGTRMDIIREEQGKRPRKYALYIVYAFIMNGSFFLAFGMYVVSTTNAIPILS